MASPFRFDTGTDIAAVAAWDPLAVPEAVAKATHPRSFEVLEAEASAGRVFLVHTGADGGGLVEVWVGEPLPAEQRASCLPVEEERRLDLPTGGLIVAGAEIYLDNSAAPSSRPEAQRIPPGSYAVQAYLPSEDSPGDPETELRRQVSSPDVQYFDSIHQRGCVFGLAMLALVFPLAHFIGWMASVAATVVLEMLFFAARERWMQGNARYQRLLKIIPAIRLRGEPPTLILVLRPLADPSACKSGAISLP